MHVLTILAQDDSGGGGIAHRSASSCSSRSRCTSCSSARSASGSESRQRCRRAIGVGDEVMTTSGMYGFITGFDGDIVWLEIDDNIQIRISRAAVQRKVDTSAATPEAEHRHRRARRTRVDRRARRR